MIIHANELIDGFMSALTKAGLGRLTAAIKRDTWVAPHTAGDLPSGKCAVYVFSIADAHGRTCPAGPNRVLKLGIAGPNSNARFRYQHYLALSAPSTLAGTLARARILWPYLGMDGTRRGNRYELRDWIKANTDRDNFYLSDRDVALLPELERYIRGRCGPSSRAGSSSSPPSLRRSADAKSTDEKVRELKRSDAEGRGATAAKRQRSVPRGAREEEAAGDGTAVSDYLVGSVRSSSRDSKPSSSSRRCHSLIHVSANSHASTC